MKTNDRHGSVMKKEEGKINKWNESIKKIPQKDEYELEGIKNWHIHDFEMVPNSSGMSEKLFRDEAVKLLDAGFDLAINAEHGVGSVHVLKDGFRIELWQNNKKKDIHKKTLDEALDWIIYFYEKCSRPGTKYTKHGVKRQHQIIDGILPLLEKISKIGGIKKVTPGKISYSPKRGISQPTLKIQRQIITGFKLLAHSKGSVQEIFIVVQNGKTGEVRRELENMISRSEERNEGQDLKKLNYQENFGNKKVERVEMSKASEVYTITAALERAEEMMNLSKDWQPKNEIQRRFLNDLLHVCRNDKIDEIELEVSDNAEKINAFLEKKGFSIRVQPFPLNTLGFASILDLIVEWLYPGEKIKIDAKNGSKYDGVRIKKESVSFFESGVYGYRHIVAGIRTKSGDIVFITVPKKPLEGLDLIETADAISKNMNMLPDTYDGVRFPMVDLDITNDIEWLKGMSTTNVRGIPAEITQAVQQIKIKMNEKGARFQSATAIVVTLRSVMTPKQDLIINEPFLVWVERHELEKPLMAAFITEESWKNPGSLQ